MMWLIVAADPMLVLAVGLLIAIMIAIRLSNRLESLEAEKRAASGAAKRDGRIRGAPPLRRPALSQAAATHSQGGRKEQAMKVYGLNEQELWDALEEAGALFENNLQFTREPDLISRRNSVYRLTLRVGDSSGPGARRAASGRCTVAANYAAHYAFMAMVFVHNPEARIITALQTYEGHRDFLDKAPDVAHRNVGSMMRPAALGVRTAKLRALTKPEGRGS